jgi:hypothetical protein
VELANLKATKRKKKKIFIHCRKLAENCHAKKQISLQALNI